MSHSPSTEPLVGAAAQAQQWYAALHQPRPLLVVISGPSGVGKDVTIQRMKERGYPCLLYTSDAA
ncbi:MAG: hypothetical protein N2204_08025, partial [Anaerolineae bacterium]|nr:hypothetical protein [Anaerolineae bacterium]